jgi:acetate kinase
MNANPLHGPLQAPAAQRESARPPASADAGILVLNCGSSSIKFALFDATANPLPRLSVWSGQVEGINTGNPRLLVADEAPLALTLGRDRPYHAALQSVRDAVSRLGGGRLPRAVAHRVVHGGSKYAAPVRVDREVLAELKRYTPLAPLHQPFALEAIGALLDETPDLQQVACFDTAFHRTLPQVEQMMALPHAFWERGIRRYGFHGLSYEYVAIALAERYGDWARGRTIVAHLGSGASLCAMKGLQSVATTMGFSALDGLMMATRCGALDAGVILHLMEQERYSPERLAHLLYHESGLLGVSGLSASPKALLAAEDTHPRARAALELYVRRIVREIGGLTAVLGGLDMLAFTAGVGEHSATLRARICEALGWLDLEVDADANAAGLPILSTAASRVCVVVEPTNEEWIAASHAQSLTGGGAPADVTHGRSADGAGGSGRSAAAIRATRTDDRHFAYDTPGGGD